jgi:thymidylate kinase
MKIVSLEGPDFSGKTTLANTLLARLRRSGLEVERMEMPTRMVTGIFTELLRNSKDDTDPKVYAMIYAADHLQHYLSTRDLKVDVLVLERGILSYFVYQHLVMGVDREWMEELNRYNRTVPDLTAVVRVPVEDLVRRSRLRVGMGDAFEKEKFLRRVAAAFYDLPDWLVKRYNVEYFPYEKDADKTAAAIAARLEKLL